MNLEKNDENVAKGSLISFIIVVVLFFAVCIGIYVHSQCSKKPIETTR